MKKVLAHALAGPVPSAAARAAPREPDLATAGARAGQAARADPEAALLRPSELARVVKRPPKAR